MSFFLKYDISTNQSFEWYVYFVQFTILKLDIYYKRGHYEIQKW